MQILLITLTLIFVLLAIAALVKNVLLRERNLDRLFADDQPQKPVVVAREPSFLARWLALAGFRRGGAASAFVVATLVLIGSGLVAAYAIGASGLIRTADTAISSVPGGLADILRPFLYLAPWIVCVTLALLPLVYVRRARRLRVQQIEQDMPVTLELLATLAEAGLGFDAALSRIIDAQPIERPLTAEFRLFQTDVLAGRPRTESLRRVARRIEVSAMTIFISAMVQAEQVGSGIATVLRTQADDLRQRRRERALELSMSLPVKSMFPMVICFLPGILLFALGPTFAEFFKYADTIIRTRL